MANPTEIEEIKQDNGGKVRHNPTQIERNETEIIGLSSENGELAVVGWLVCLSKPHRGKDYRIHSGFNDIGSGKNVDICLSDSSISSRMCRILYDPKGNRYYITVSDVMKNLVYVNDVPLLQPTELHNLDRIYMGKSEFIFIALCGDNFSWEE